jgi:uncharacterized protein (DUF1778 family)
MSYAIDPHKSASADPMPRAISDAGRLEIRIGSDAKATLARAAALGHVAPTTLNSLAAMPAAAIRVERAEHIKLSERDGHKVLAILENPPAPSVKLRAAAKGSSTARTA